MASWLRGRHACMYACMFKLTPVISCQPALMLTPAFAMHPNLPNDKLVCFLLLSLLRFASEIRF